MKRSKLFHALTLAPLVIGVPNSAAIAAPGTIRNDMFWKDSSGTPIYSQGGGVLKVGRKYYWYGAKYDASVTYAQNPVPTESGAIFNAVTVYSSTDLVNWRFEGDALKPGSTAHPLRGRWFGRMGVAYNSRTRKYVLASQYSDPVKGAGVFFATSDTPAGPFVFDNLQTRIENLSTQSSGDQTLFIDDDGRPYLVFSNSGTRRELYVAPLRTSDYLQVGPATKVYDAPGGGREGSAIFKRNGLYYFLSSDLHGWNASRTFYMTARNIAGPYSPERILSGTERDFSHVSQNGFLVAVRGSKDTTILYAGDRWSNFASNGLGYNVWVPLSFDGVVPRFNSLSQFDLDAATGTWSVGKGNNYILNPSFEADRVTQTGLAGWRTTWTNLKGVGPTMNVRGGRTGKWALNLAHDDATMGNAVQDVDLPNGRYTLKAWVRASGGQAVARLYAAGHGGPHRVQDLTRPAADWTEVTVPAIQVRTGRVQIGVYVEGQKGQWLNLDDFSLVRD